MALVVVGTAMAVVGALGLAFSWGETPATVRASSSSTASGSPSSSSGSSAASSAGSSSSSATDSSSSGSSASSSSSSSSSGPPPGSEDPHKLFASLQKAIHDGDTGFLFDRLDPAVIDRYGADQCREGVKNLVDKTIDLTLEAVTGPTTYAYESDNRSTDVPDTYLFSASGTANGRRGLRQFHLPLVDGTFRIFADCGTPTGPG